MARTRIGEEMTPEQASVLVSILADVEGHLIAAREKLEGGISRVKAALDSIPQNVVDSNPPGVKGAREAMSILTMADIFCQTAYQFVKGCFSRLKVRELYQQISDLEREIAGLEQDFRASGESLEGFIRSVLHEFAGKLGGKK